MRHQRVAPVVATLGPIYRFVQTFYGGIFPLLRYFPRHPYSHDDVVECEQDFVGTVGKPKLEQFRRQLIWSHSLAIGHRSQGLFCLTHSRRVSDRAVGFCDRPSIIVRLRVAEVVLSKEVKYCLHLARISSSFRRSFPSSSLIYCALLNFLPCNFHPRLRCPCQPLKSLATMNSSSSQANTSKYLSSAAWIISPSFLHAFRNARKAEPPAKVPCTAFRASYLSVQTSSDSSCIASSSNNPDIRDCRIWPGITYSADRRSVSVNRAAFSPTVPPSPPSSVGVS